MSSDFAMKTMNAIHRGLLKISGGKAGWRVSDMPVLELTTIGRKTGQSRTTPLLYAQVGSDWVVTASNWGQPHHPSWSTNLIANPDASIEVGRQRVDVYATLTGGPEREQLWAAVTQVWPAYDTYAERSGRDLRVFRLTRR